MISDNAANELAKRKSPALDLPVLCMQGDVFPGHSGSPVLDASGFVIGVVSGALKYFDSQSIGVVAKDTSICWAIPISGVEWSPRNSVATRNAIEKIAAQREMAGLQSLVTIPGKLQLALPSYDIVKAPEGKAVSIWNVGPKKAEEALLKIALKPIEMLFGGIDPNLATDLERLARDGAAPPPRGFSRRPPNARSESNPSDSRNVSPSSLGSGTERAPRTQEQQLQNFGQTVVDAMSELERGTSHLRFSVPSGTQIVILEKPNREKGLLGLPVAELVKIRVVSGIHRGETGWLSPKFISTNRADVR